MEISEYSKYAITNRNPEFRSRFITVKSTAATMSALIGTKTIRIDEIHDYEIYIVNADTGQTGWGIHNVRSTDFMIKNYPDFDCIITRNDCPPDYEFSDFDGWHNNKVVVVKLDN